MENETLTVYSAINPLEKKIIPKRDKEQFLDCKFWKESKEEADLFINFYRGPVYCEFHRIVAILSERLFRTQNIANSYKNISKLIDRYRAEPNKDYFLKIPRYKNILDAMWSESYPKYSLIDDVIHWAEIRQLINAETSSTLAI